MNLLVKPERESESQW